MGKKMIVEIDHDTLDFIQRLTTEILYLTQEVNDSLDTPQPPELIDSIVLCHICKEFILDAAIEPEPKTSVLEKILQWFKRIVQ